MALLSNINNLFSVDSTGEIKFNDKAGTAGYVLVSAGTGGPPVWTDRDTGGVRGTGTENKVVRWNVATTTGVPQTIGDGPITFSGSAATATSTFGGHVGIDVAAHGTASLNITNTDQHIRLNNGSELGIISLDTDGKLDLWAHGTDETINFRTGTGSGTVTMSVVGEKVGIGTDLPNALLNLSQAAGANIRFDNETTTNYFTIGEGVGTNNVFSFRGNSYRSTDTMSIDFVNDRVGIGTISPAMKIDVEDNSTTWAGRVLNTNANGAGLLVRSDATTANDTIVLGVYGDGGYKMAVKSGGNVGIGVSSPVGKLQVSLPTYTNEDTNSQQAIFGVDSGYGVRIGYNETDNKGYINVLKPGVAWGSLILQEDIGKVGIGTDSPSGKLSVTGTGTATAPTFDVINTSTNQFNHSVEAMTPNMTTGQNNIFVIGRQSTTKESGYIGYKWSSSGSNANVLTFGHWGSDNLMNIDGLGNVGIGITAPVPKLHLAYSGGSYGTDATSGFINQADTGRATQRIRSITDNAAELFFDVNGGIRWDISARGSASSHALHFYPQAPTPVYNNVAAHTFQLSQNGDVIVTGAGSSGRLGIGTTSPSAALDVAGASAANIGAAIIRENSTLAYTATSFNARPTITMWGINTTNTYVGTRLSNAGNTEFFQGIVKGANNGEITYVWQGYNGTAYQQFGAIDCYGTGAGSLVMSGDIVAYSDKKLKKNIKTLDGSKVYKMRGVSFDRIDTGKSSSGVIAQEMQEVAPELVNESDDTLGVAYGNLTGYLIEAIKDLKAEIEELKKCKCDCKK